MLVSSVTPRHPFSRRLGGNQPIALKLRRRPRSLASQRSRHAPDRPFASNGALPNFVPRTVAVCIAAAAVGENRPTTIQSLLSYRRRQQLQPLDRLCRPSFWTSSRTVAAPARLPGRHLFSAEVPQTRTPGSSLSGVPSQVPCRRSAAAMAVSGSADPAFKLETTCTFDFPTRPIPVTVYKHTQCDFRVIFADVRGPLASATIVVGTLSDNHKGLPHTLEHRALPPPWFPRLACKPPVCERNQRVHSRYPPKEDHTAYSIVTAGQQGMCEVLPVFVDHVLNPTLREEQFVTEVELPREHTEADLLDLNLRQLIYPPDTTYAYECGGLTPYIAQLTNDDIKHYHQTYYQAGRTTVIIVGEGISSARVLLRLEKAAGLVGGNPIPDFAKRRLNIPDSLPWAGENYRSRTVPFPSSDNTVGSVGYAWLGPRSQDFRTILAIDVLFRYLHETKASPLAQRFVERNLASNVDYELKGY
ncbi:MAG: hypothetical protein BJ554DRAFT_4886, partial [Olpidium bornovanus]